jgi:hypothetical protein
MSTDEALGDHKATCLRFAFCAFPFSAVATSMADPPGKATLRLKIITMGDAEVGKVRVHAGLSPPDATELHHQTLL